MKFISVRALRTYPGRIWKELPDQQEMVITNNGKPIALLTPISEANLERTIKSVRKALAFDAVRQMQEISRSKGNDTMSEQEIDAIIKEVRKKNRR